MFNTIEALMIYNSPDVVEKTDWGFYLGFLEKGTDINDSHNCMIIEMRTVGSITTKKFAEGNNYNYVCTWAERQNYEYKFPTRNI